MSRAGRCFSFSLFTLLCAGPASTAWAEDKLISVHEPPEQTRSINESLNFPTDARLFELVNRVIKFTHLPENPFLIQISDDDSIETPTANATGYLKIKGVVMDPEKAGVVDYIETERLIVFNQAYVVELLNATEQDKGKTPWRLISLVAHEIGHFVGRHHDTQMDRKTQEWQADWVAGYILSRMGATKEQAIEWLAGEAVGASLNYPSRKDREDATGRGWKRAKDNPKTFTLSDLMDKNLDNHREQFDDFHGLDIRGEDICIARGRMSRQACANVCLNLENCQAFSYDRWSGYCFPKKAVVIASREANSTLGVRKKLGTPSVSTGEITFKQKTEHTFPYYPSDPKGRPFLKDKQVAGPRDCEKQCASKDYCTAYSVSEIISGEADAETAGAVSETPTSFTCSLFRLPPKPVPTGRTGDAIGYKYQNSTVPASGPVADCDN
jgi:hypothetical protein